MIVKNLVRALSPSGSEARLSILIFHRVLSEPDPLFPGEPDIRRFNDLVSWVRHWFNVLPLDKAVMQLQGGRLPSRAAAITFDDGYADNVSNALPVLQSHGLTATFFVSTAFLDGGRMWNDSVIETIRHCSLRVLDLRSSGWGIFSLETPAHKRSAIDALLTRIKYIQPEQRQQRVDDLVETISDMTDIHLPTDLMMRSEQLLVLRNAGMQMGAHTVSHPILEQTTDQQAVWEIAGSKAALESRLAEPVSLFAYPNGKPDVDYSARHVGMVRDAGFVAAVSTARGAAGPNADPFQLPRFTPWEQSRTRFGLRMLANLRAGVPARVCRENRPSL